MGRSDFGYQPNVHVNDILLDTANARIRASSDQNNCIERILRKSDQLLALMEDIAADGLTTIPILISPSADGKWVVRDGNRRITAIKLLNDPERCSDAQIRARIKNIREKYKKNLFDTVDCLSSDNEAAIIREVVARHSGAMGGVGQLDWSAYLRTIYLMNHGHTVDYKRAGQYLFWAERNDIYVDDTFPITTVTRFFNAANLLKLGFSIENDDLVAVLPHDKIKRMTTRIIMDFDSGAKKVEDVFTTTDAEKYIEEVRAEAGVEDPPSGEESGGDSSLIEKSDGDGGNGSSRGRSSGGDSTRGDGDQSDQQPRRRRTSSPRKQPWDRNRLFGRSGPGLSIPDDQPKVRSFVAELRSIDVKVNPLATAMLLRGLIEMSEGYYRPKNNIRDKGGLSKNIAACADKMLPDGAIKKDQYEVVLAYTREAQGMLHIKSLQSYIHKDTFHPNFQTINTFWDEFGCFVQACWR